MAKEWAIKFYNMPKWHRVRTAYMTSQYWRCERCGAGAEICHHKVWLTPTNINDPDISLSWNNLEALCRLCHEIEHEVWRGSKKNEAVDESLIVREDGTIEGENITVDNLLDGLIL